jgi:hypothetical protein
MSAIDQTQVTNRPASRKPFPPFTLALTLMAAALALGARIIAPHKASLASLWSIPLTVLGIGAIDTGVFLASAVAGWIVLGLSLVLLEHMIADER